MRKPDVSVENHGTLFLVRPLTEAAQMWIDENVQKDAQFLGGALVVEHRYICDLVDGMISDALVVG